MVEAKADGADIVKSTIGWCLGEALPWCWPLGSVRSTVTPS